MNDDLPQQINWFGPPLPPGPPSKACQADTATIKHIDEEKAQDATWLNQHCGNDWAMEIKNGSPDCREHGQDKLDAYNRLVNEESSELNQAREDCNPLPMRTLLASFRYEYDADDEIRQISFNGDRVNYPNTTGARASSTDV